MSLDMFNQVASVVAVITAATSAWLWYDRNRRDLKLDNHDREIVSLRNDFILLKSNLVTEPQVRVLIREETFALRENHSELKTMVSSLSAQINSLSTNQQVQTHILESLLEQVKELKAQNQRGSP